MLALRRAAKSERASSAERLGRRLSVSIFLKWTYHKSSENPLGQSIPELIETMQPQTRLVGLEPTTDRLEGGCSYPLSYKRKNPAYC